MNSHKEHYLQRCCLVFKSEWVDSNRLPHTAGLDTIFVQIYMDALPGVPGVSKNQIFFFTNETVEFLR